MVNLVGTNQNVAGVSSHQKAIWGPGVSLGIDKIAWGYGHEAVYKTQTPGKFIKFQARILELLEKAPYSRW